MQTVTITFPPRTITRDFAERIEGLVFRTDEQHYPLGNSYHVRTASPGDLLNRLLAEGFDGFSLWVA